MPSIIYVFKPNTSSPQEFNSAEPSTITSWLMFSCNCCFCFSVSFPGEVNIDVTLQLVMDADFSSDLFNRTSSKLVAMEENIKTSVR